MPLSLYKGGASFSVLEALGERALLDVSPIILMKAKKNNVEIAGRVQGIHVGDILTSDWLAH